IAGFSPTLLFLLVFRTLLGIGMGAEWPAGAALAMEQWPIRSRGFMSGVLQGSWSIGFLLSSVIWGVFGDYIGWRGMLWIGVLPALSIVYIRYFVTEPPIWVENRRQQREKQHEVRAPLIEIFKRGMLANTLLACRAPLAALSTASCRAICPSGFRPRCAPRQAPSATTRGRSSAALSPRCLPISRSISGWAMAPRCWSGRSPRR